MSNFPGALPVSGLSQKYHHFCGVCTVRRAILAPDHSTRFFTDLRSNIMRITRSLGSLLLAIYLIITGLTHFIHLSFSGMSLILGGLAIGAGVLLILGV